ncbi:hypothetical protein GGR92_005208 [Spirosoma lacussanchae]|uniref:SGNH/GDSL hydrolase family protein n=1 Tax=Spirosoma lacussanchae TaxID=1884249 RepID=UPI0011093D9C|nr:SGNH/GDSL hydrolase family protein [Spirosoma lacussanchae]
MKTIILLLFSLLSLASFGQTGFPTTITNQRLTVSGAFNIDEIVETEGQQLSWTFGVSARPASTSSALSMGTMPNYNPRMFIAMYRKTYVEWQSSWPVQLNMGNSDWFAVNYSTISTAAKRTGQVEYRRNVNYPLESISLSGHRVGDTINAVGLTELTLMTNDLNPQANKKILWLGDSRTVGTLNNDMTQDQIMQWGVQNWINAQAKATSGNIYRSVIVARGGMKSGDIVNALENRLIRVENPALIFSWFDLNDQGQSVPVSTYETNTRRELALLRRFYPDATIIKMTSSPVANTTKNTAVDAYRNKLIEVVASLNDSKIKVIDLRKSFDRTLGLSVWAASDSNGGAVNVVTDGIHPGTALSHQGIINTITTGTNFDGTTTTGLQQLGITF